jgi:hypothetical protein
MLARLAMVLLSVAPLAEAIDLRLANAGEYVVLIQSEKALPEELEAAFQEETSRIFNPTPFRIRLRYQSDQSETAEYRNLIIATLRGDPLPLAPPPPYTREPGAFGYTPRTDDVMHPFVSIDCERVAQSIHPFIRGEKTAERRRKTGVALARVLAHELYHVISGSAEHADSGIAMKGLRGDHLVQRSLLFTTSDVLRMLRLPLAAE